MCKMVGEQDGMLKDLKLLLGMDPEDASQDDKLLWILQSARARLKVLLGGLAISGSWSVFPGFRHHTAK